MKRTNVIPRVMLLIIILLMAAYGFLNYNALLNADSYTYLIYARELARGSFFGEPGFFEIFKDRWPESGTIDLHSGLRHLIAGKVYHGVEMGYPLFLAAAMVLAGPSAVYFVNPILFLWFVVVFFLAIRLVFFKSPHREIIALLGVLIMLLLPPDRLLSSATKIMRDIPPLTFIITSYYCLLRALCTDRYSGIRIFIGAFFLGLAALIRFHYVIMALPFFLYLFASLRADKTNLKARVRYILFALLGLAIFVLPVIIRDLLVNRNMFFTAQVILAHLLSSSDSLKLFSPDHFTSSGLGYLDYLARIYSPGLIFLGLVGLVAGWKNRVIRLLFVPSALLHFLLFAFFRYHHSRYLLPIYPVISCMIAYGIIVSLNWILAITSRSHGRNLISLLCRVAGALLLIYLVFLGVSGQGPILSPWNAVLLIVSLAILIGAWPPVRRIDIRRLSFGLGFCLFLILGVNVGPAIIHPYSFNLADARHLKKEIEKHVPPGSLILSTRYLKQNIDYYTGCYAMNIHQPGLPWGLTFDEAIREVMDAGVAVFVLDNKGKRKAAKFLPVLKEHFKVSSVARWRSEDLGIHIRYVSELEYLNLYRVLPQLDK